MRYSLIVLLLHLCLVSGHPQLRRKAERELVSNEDDEQNDTNNDSCTGGRLVKVEIALDWFPEQTSWTISDGENILDGGSYAKELLGSTVTTDVCLADGCYSFVIKDTNGNGMCCDGSYSVSTSETMLASGGVFASSETTEFCLGGTMNSIKPATTPDASTAQGISTAQQTTTTTSTMASTYLSASRVVGAGAAGLAASYTLNHHGITDFVIVEASNTLGGRAQKDTTFTNGSYPLDLGPSFIQYPSAIRRIIGRDDIIATPPNPYRLPTFANYSYHDFLNDYIAPSSTAVQYGCRVNGVDYTTDEVVTVCEDGRRFLSQFVIVTVPLPILKDRDIAFNPPLPASMTTNHPAWIWGGFKLILEFKTDFLSSFCFPDIPGAQGECINRYSENFFWDVSSINPRLDNGHTIVAGYILGVPSDYFVSLSDDDIAQRVVELMDRRYGGLASEQYVGHLVQNWSNNPDFRGAFSSRGYDELGAQNIQDRVWVAGEAFPVDGSEGWVDSGIFSGDDAAKQILSRHYGIEDDTWFWQKVWEDLGR